MDTSTRHFGLALVAALCLHGLLLVQKLAFKEPSRLSQKPLSVTMLKQDLSEPRPKAKLPKERETFEIIEKAVKPSPTSIKADQVIVVSPSTNRAEPRVTIQTSTQSTSFKRWLNSETENFTGKNPDSINGFEKTFEPPTAYQSPEELSPYHRKSVPRGSTLFDTEYKGKTTCVAKNINLLDITAGPSFVFKDCTSRKKFDLKLNRPNNGWSDR